MQQVLPATLEAIVRLRSGLVGFENELLMEAHQSSKSGPVAAETVKGELEAAVVGESASASPIDLFLLMGNPQ